MVENKFFDALGYALGRVHYSTSLCAILSTLSLNILCKYIYTYFKQMSNITPMIKHNYKILG
jgi:hypothetical protein